MELDYFTCILNKQNLQAERPIPAQRGSLLLQAYSCRLTKQKYKDSPVSEEWEEEASLWTQTLLLEMLAAVAQVTLLVPAEDGRQGRAQHWQCESTDSASVLCHGFLCWQIYIELLNQK